jgi:23S rRNA (uracil1939-C5)-methyltransferase
MPKPTREDQLELTIESLAFGGRGVAKKDGFVVFVSGAFPGDRVLARVTRARRSYAEASTIEVLEPSAGRVETPCDHYGVCGGCAWQPLSYEAQLRYKQSQVSECMQHIGGLEATVTEPAIAADQRWRYRNKVEFSFGGDEGGGLQLGFHRAGQWRHLVDIEDCRLHSEETNHLRNLVRDLASCSGAGPWDQKDGTGFWRHLVIREAANTGEIMVNIVTAPGDFPKQEEFARTITREFPRVASLVWSVNDSPANVASGFPFSVLAGADHISERIGGLDLKVSPSSFLQTNTLMAEVLYSTALDFAGADVSVAALDLYCGIGSIALLLAGRSREVLGIEIVEEAVAMARENAVRNGIRNATFESGKVRALLKDLVAAGRAPSLVVLDPPRAGAGKKEIDRIIELAPARVVYVSCNPSTLAANAAQLVEGGYELSRVVPVDMFPQTPHIEVVSRFDRQDLL